MAPARECGSLRPKIIWEQHRVSVLAVPHSEHIDVTKISPLFIIAAATCLAPRPASAENLSLSGYVLTFDEEFNGRSISQSGVGTTWADIRSWARYDAASDIGFGKSSFLDAASGYDPFSVGG